MCDPLPTISLPGKRFQGAAVVILVGSNGKTIEDWKVGNDDADEPPR